MLHLLGSERKNEEARPELPKKEVTKAIKVIWPDGVCPANPKRLQWKLAVPFTRLFDGYLGKFQLSEDSKLAQIVPIRMRLKGTIELQTRECDAHGSKDTGEDPMVTYCQVPCKHRPNTSQYGFLIGKSCTANHRCFLDGVARRSDATERVDVC